MVNINALLRERPAGIFPMLVWVLFGHVTLTETKALIAADSPDHGSVDEHLKPECARLLRA